VEAVRTGEPQTVPALGDEIFDYYAKTPGESEAFTQAMASFSSRVAAEAVRLIDLEPVSEAIDVGGANGTLVLALMKASPKLRGGVLDLPHVMEAAREATATAGVADRFTAIAGDMFKTIPPAGLYLLKFVLHDWDDAACVTILRNCAQSMHAGGRIAVIEMLLGEIGEEGPAALLDLNMLVMASGRERSRNEYEALFGKAGLRLAKVAAMQPPYSILEAVRA
jgi:O-methyltransferase domain